MPTRQTEEQARAQGATGENSDAPHPPTPALAQQGADSPETRERTGQVVAPVDTIPGTDIPVAPDPASEGTRQAADSAGKVRVLEAPKPEEQERRIDRLPREAFDSEGFRAANGAARDSFASVVCFPGHRFVDHGGRYASIYDLNEVYDVEPNSVVPEGTYLIPVNYLERDAALVANRRDAR